jgi:hypothetical protein
MYFLRHYRRDGGPAMQVPGNARYDSLYALDELLKIKSCLKYYLVSFF